MHVIFRFISVICVALCSNMNMHACARGTLVFLRLDFAHQEVHKGIELLIEEVKKTYTPPTRHLIYEVASYHRPVSFFNIDAYIRELPIGPKSPCPTLVEGQLILSFLSFSSGIKHRAAYLLGKVICFNMTRESGNITWYHGHFYLSDNFSRNQDLKNALQSRGIINGKGRFLQ